MMDWLGNAGGFWAYVILFLLAAAPWLEVFLVVPLGIAMGMNPVGVAVAGFVGNWIPILLIGFFFKQLSAWREKRKAKKLQSGAAGLPSDPDAQTDEPPKIAKKHRRARVVWEKYGIPGLALLAPTIVGTDIAAILALSFGSNRTWVMLWMTVSLAVWTVLLTVGSVYGFAFVGWTH